MKVVLVCPYAWDRFGGVQTHVGSLARALTQRSHEVRVIAPRSSRDPIDDGLLAPVGRAVPVPANGSVAPIAFGPLAAAGVRRALAAFAPEVVHLHEPLVPSLSLLALWNAAAPTIGTFHAAADGSVGYRLGRPVLGRAARRLSARTAVSDAARALASRYFPADYVLTPNGVDFAAFRDAEPLPSDGRKRVLFFGRIEARKGLVVLLQAMTRLRDLDVELLVAGAGPQERAARDLARQVEVDARFLGPVDDATKPRIFRSASVYCAPGLGGESFGIVLLEAMAAGTPLVCSDLPGFREAAGEVACFAPLGDAGALADALRAVLTDEERAARMGRDGLRRAQMFDWSRLAAGIEALYARIATEGGAR